MKPLYAVIDLETTGGKPFQDRIIEIAIVLHDGQQIVESFSSLVNPERPIPPFISKLTGIQPEMLSDAPKFYEIAKKVVEMTESAIFVAHNAHFDYSFLKAEFKTLGYQYQRKTLCTLRLSRQLLLAPSYSLGKLCKHLGIGLQNRHRAEGDATATAHLLAHLIETDAQSTEQGILNEEIKLPTLPPNISHEAFEELPEDVGVYYFLDQAGDILYIGKSKNIKRRVATHFQTASQNRKQIAMKNQIHGMRYTETGSELVALLLESAEIKKYKPRFNRAQRRSIFRYGIFYRFNAKGYMEFYVDKIKTAVPLFFADTMPNAQKILQYQFKKHQLCAKYCGLYPHEGPCFDYHIKACQGACIGQEAPESYNERALGVVTGLTAYVKPHFFIIGRGRNHLERSLVLVENGCYVGFGYIPFEEVEGEAALLKSYIEKYQDNKDTQQIIKGYLKDTQDVVRYF